MAHPPASQLAVRSNLNENPARSRRPHPDKANSVYLAPLNDLLITQIPQEKLPR